MTPRVDKIFVKNELCSSTQMFIKFKILSGKEFTSLLIYLFVQVPVGTLPSGMKLGFLEMEPLTSHNQFLLGLGINSDNQDFLIFINLELQMFS